MNTEIHDESASDVSFPSTAPSEAPPVEEPPGVAPIAEPPVVEPPSEVPPVVEPPSEAPPSIAPPSETPPSVEPPGVEPPSIEPPSETPPSIDPPSEAPPSIEPPSEAPPIGDPQPTDSSLGGPLVGGSITGSLATSTAVELSIGEPIPLDRESVIPPPPVASADAPPTDSRSAADARRRASLAELSPYEFEALAEITEVKNPHVRWLSRLVNVAHEPIDKLGGSVFDTQVGGWVGDALGTVLRTIHDGATWTVREQAILQDFERGGHRITSFAEVPTLSLESVDDVVGGLARKYRIAAMLEGSLVGATGFAGMLADIPLIISIALRGVTELAAYYGFYPLDDAEKRFVLDLLSTASAPTLKSRQESLAQLTQLIPAAGSPTEAVNRDDDAIFANQAVERLIEGVLSRMARGKVAQAIPLFGAVIGGGFNRWFVAQVMSLAQALYRERFLMRRHNAPQLVEVKTFEALM